VIVACQKGGKLGAHRTSLSGSAEMSRSQATQDQLIKEIGSRMRLLSLRPIRPQSRRLAVASSQECSKQSKDNGHDKHQRQEEANAELQLSWIFATKAAVELAKYRTGDSHQE